MQKGVDTYGIFRKNRWNREKAIQIDKTYENAESFIRTIMQS